MAPKNSTRKKYREVTREIQKEHNEWLLINNGKPGNPALIKQKTWQEKWHINAGYFGWMAQLVYLKKLKQSGLFETTDKIKDHGALCITNQILSIMQDKREESRVKCRNRDEAKRGDLGQLKIEAGKSATPKRLSIKETADQIHKTFNQIFPVTNQLADHFDATQENIKHTTDIHKHLAKDSMRSINTPDTNPVVGSITNIDGQSRSISLEPGITQKAIRMVEVIDTDVLVKELLARGEAAAHLFLKMLPEEYTKVATLQDCTDQDLFDALNKRGWQGELTKTNIVTIK